MIGRDGRRHHQLTGGIINLLFACLKAPGNRVALENQRFYLPHWAHVPEVLSLGENVVNLRSSGETPDTSLK